MVRRFVVTESNGLFRVVVTQQNDFGEEKEVVSYQRGLTKEKIEAQLSGFIDWVDGNNEQTA